MKKRSYKFWQRRDVHAKELQTSDGLPTGPLWAQVRYRTTYDEKTGRYLELSRPSWEITEARQERAPLIEVLPGRRPGQEMEPTDLITTLWYETQETGDEEDQIMVHESSFYAYLPEPPPGATAPGEGSGEAPPKAQVYHILEEPGAIDWRNEVQVPTEEYYDALRADLDKRFPKASRFVLDHLISLEALLDIAILSGFSFGLDKAKPFAIIGELLGDWVGRKGRWPNDDRIKQIKDFAAIKTKQQVQQFLGCANWVRSYLPHVYPQLVTMLGHLLKPDFVFPAEGYHDGGTGKEDLIINAIKLCCQHYIYLAVLDEAAAADGTCPLELLVDGSGIAWGGSAYQK